MEFALHTTLDLFSFLVLAIILVICFLNQNRKRMTEKVFTWMEIVMLALLVSDGIAFALMGHSRAVPTIRFFWGLSYVLGTTVIVLFHFYAGQFLVDYKKVEINFHAPYYIIVSVIMNLVWLIGLPLEIFTIIDADGYYYHTQYHILTQASYFLLLIPDYVMVLKHRNKLEDKGWSWFIFLTVPVVTRILDITLHVSMIFPMLTLAIVYSYDSLNQETDMALKEQTIELQRQEKELQETREKVVISQIQPHFLYNVLNTICILCRKNPPLAEKTTADFATYLRMNLDFLSMDKPVLFDEEQKHTEIYLGLEKLRFGEDMHVEWDIRTRNFLLPVLTLQPIVENAVKHGICQKENGGTVWISTREEKDEVVIVVKDDGVGFDISQLPTDDGKTHIGMENTRRRLEAISKGTMTVESTPGVGTTVTLHIPKERRQ